MDTPSARAFWSEHPVDPGWIAHYQRSVDAPHRQWVVEALQPVPEWTTLFEIGCHCGPQLRAIQAAYPEAVLSGCDVNAEAVAEARAVGWSGAVVGAFPAVTADWPDQSVDVVLSCYTLAYLGPADIEAGLAEAGRIARRGIVLCEPMAWDLAQAEELVRGLYTEWRHPYLHLLWRLPGFSGWTAHCREVTSDSTRLSGLLTVVRP